MLTQVTSAVRQLGATWWESYHAHEVGSISVGEKYDDVSSIHWMANEWWSMGSQYDTKRRRMTWKDHLISSIIMRATWMSGAE